MTTYTMDEWLAEGKKLFGENRSHWQFVCPRCKTIQSASDFMRLAENQEKMRDLIVGGIVGFSCMGRYVPGKIGCDWTCGGFLQIHTAEVILDDGKKSPVFEFYKQKRTI